MDIEKITNIPHLPPRAKDAHKGTFGKAMIIAGSVGMSGAAALAGKAALRSGAGLVRIAVPKSILPTVASIEPSYTTIALPDDTKGQISKKALNIITENIMENDVVAFGCGVGLSPSVRSILDMLISRENLKLVIDADGLNNICKIKNWPEINKADLVLTPHPGEMKRLWQGLYREPLPDDRLEQAVQLAQRTKTTVLLKGAGTVVTNGKKAYINTTGNPGMATAGSGDVLTGIIAALIGQGMNNFDAASYGSYIHGLAGDLAAEELGRISLIATDIIDALPVAFSEHEQ